MPWPRAVEKTTARGASRTAARKLSDRPINAQRIRGAQRPTAGSAGHLSETGCGDSDHQWRAATIWRRAQACTRLMDSNIKNDMASITKPRAAAPL